LKLLVDNNLSPSLAHSLQPLFPDHQILALRDKFPANTRDVEWIKTLDRENGWAVLTAERRLKTRPHERLALDRSQIVFFFLTGAWLKYGIPEMAWRLIRVVPLMEKQTDLTESGLFDLPVNATSKLRPHQR
jgi:PIN domain-containing protein